MGVPPYTPRSQRFDRLQPFSLFLQRRYSLTFLCLYAKAYRHIPNGVALMYVNVLLQYTFVHSVPKAFMGALARTLLSFCLYR